MLLWHVPPQASWCGGPLHRKDFNSRANAVPSTGMWCAFSAGQRNVHIRLLRLNVLFVFVQLPGQQEPQISRQLNTYETRWSGNILFLQTLPQPLPNCDNGCNILGTIYRRMTFGTFMAFRMWEYTPALLPGVLYCVIMRLFGHPLLWHVCFIWSGFVIIYSYNDKLPVTSIFNTMNLSFNVLYLFPAVYKTLDQNFCCGLRTK